MRAFGVALLAAVCLGATACSGVPTSGPIEEGPVVAVAGQDQFIRVIARPPVAGMAPEDLVRGFQEASASADNSYFVAREYLTGKAAATWDPGAGVAVYDNGGLSYGMWFSSPTMVMWPSKPNERRVSAARTPANDAPTMTILCTEEGYGVMT